MVDAVLLVLREVLEAALIVSLLLALTFKLGLNHRWCMVALTIGFFGSLTLAQYAPVVAEALDGIAQEAMEVLLYAVVIISVLCIGFLIIRMSFLQTRAGISAAHFQLQHKDQSFLKILCSLVVSFSLAREGSEIWIYFSSFEIQSPTFYPALTGAFIGIGIGVSLGGIAYYILTFTREKYFMWGFLFIITLLAGGLALQVAKQFLQVGLLDSAGPLWDSSFLINERSWLGEFLYALFGYDAQPTAVQAYFYLAAVAPMVLFFLYYLISSSGKKNAT